MSISNPIARNDYVGNGATITWTYGFKVFAEGDIAVYVYNTLTGLLQALVLNVDYTVSGVGSDTGGSITQIIGISIPAILPATSTLTIKRGMAFTQPAALNNQGQFFPKTIEDSLDRMTMLLQQMNDIVGGSLHLGPNELPTTGNSTIPSLALRASKFFGWDALGNILAVAATIPSALVSAFWTPILTLTTSLASRTAIGTKEVVYATDSGVSPNHVLSGANIAASGFVAPSAYLDGAIYTFKAAFSSTGGGTLNVNGLGAKLMRKKGADPITGATLYIACSLRDYSLGEYITVQYNLALDQFVIVSAIYAQDSMVSYGVSGASAGTTYDTGNGIKRVNFAITGHIFAFKVDVANTGACTLNVNATGAKPLKIAVFGAVQDPPAGLFQAGDVIEVVYDGTNYVVLQDSSIRKLVSSTSVAAVATSGNIPLIAGMKSLIEYQLTQNTVNGTLGLRFNADAGGKSVV